MSLFNLSQTSQQTSRGETPTVYLSLNGGLPFMENLLWGNPLALANMAISDFLPMGDMNLADFVLGGGPAPRPPASTRIIESLPVTVVNKKEEEGCPVCQSDYEIGESVMTLPCSHKFHPDCVKPWLRTHNTCPTCRFELETDDAAYNEDLRRRRASGTAGAPQTTDNSSQQQHNREIEQAPRTAANLQTIPITDTTRPSGPAQDPAEEPRVRLVRIGAPRPQITINLDPQIVAEAQSRGVPLSQLIPLILSREARSMAPRQSTAERRIIMRRPVRLEHQVEDSTRAVRQPLPRESQEALDAALREFDDLARARPSEPPSREPQSAQPSPERPHRLQRSQSDHSNPPPSSIGQARSTDDPIASSHLEALASHSQFMKLHSELLKNHQPLNDEQTRVHCQAVAAHADMMAAHRVFMESQCPKLPKPQNFAKAKSSSQARDGKREVSSLEESMERNLQQYFQSSQKKRRNDGSNERSRMTVE